MQKDFWQHHRRLTRELNLSQPSLQFDIYVTTRLTIVLFCGLTLKIKLPWCLFELSSCKMLCCTHIQFTMLWWPLARTIASKLTSWTVKDEKIFLKINKSRLTEMTNSFKRSTKNFQREIIKRNSEIGCGASRNITLRQYSIIAYVQHNTSFSKLVW